MNDLENMVMISSFSYFAVDTVWGFAGGYNDFWMNFHHVIIFVSYIDCYFQYAALTQQMRTPTGCYYALGGVHESV